MTTETITYKDFDGNERTEKFYFNLTEEELTGLELSSAGGLKKMMETLIETNNYEEIWKVIEKIVILAYGEKSVDGRIFDKSKEAKLRFTQTQAFSDFIMSLARDSQKAANFVNGLVSTATSAGNNANQPQLVK